jgi:hypothetical protein
MGLEHRYAAAPAASAPIRTIIDRADWPVARPEDAAEGRHGRQWRRAPAERPAAPLIDKTTQSRHEGKHRPTTEVAGD